MRKRWWSLFFIAAFCLSFISGPDVSSGNAEKVYIVPIHNEVEKGLANFLSRAIETAEEGGAEAIIFDINTPGGAVDAADRIGQIFTETDIKTVAFVDNRALSAGAFISLNADEIYMVPGATMGAAAVITSDGNAANEKAQSYWLANMEKAAESSGRDPSFAKAMAETDIDLPSEYDSWEGKLLTLTASQAGKVGYSEGTVENEDALLAELGLQDAEKVMFEETFADKIARFLTNPYIIPILLTIGTIGLIVELFSPGFGLPGVAGISALLLFFFGHLVSGLAGYETLILFIVGIGLILLEFFIPGGIIGIVGFIAIIASLFLASGDVELMAKSIFIALLAAFLVAVILIKFFGKRFTAFDRLVLFDSTSTEKGYISNVNRVELIGKEGVLLTALRPAGTALVDGERVDVVSEGSFINKGTAVKIVKVEGSRVVVRQLDEKNE
ncbi:NfeD family protein [Pradoshia eiseniae]|uniref:NfeD family protein n=1 Tax=Pradoshia eiseniae TaxID=2064768 RepID=UPI001F355358|nr:nodulation protein NfeD [Pradoshia eiseniae]